MNDEKLDRLRIGEEIECAPGLVVERRCFLKMVVAALAAVALPRAGAALSQDAGPPHLTFEQFLEEANPLAQRLVGDTSSLGQDRYLLTLASYAVRLSGVPIPKAWRDSNQSTGPGTFIGFNPGGDPFRVLHWRMEPGTVIRPHAHTYGNVVTLGLEGSLRVQNFEMLGKRDFDTPETFKVRRTQDQILLPGRTNLVSLEHDYIHAFTAGRDGARGLDITTRIKERRATPYLKLAARPVDAVAQVYEATWTT